VTTAAVSKRVVDVVGASLLLLALSPVLLVVVVAIRATSPGSPFFCQIRVGRDGVPFCMYKFRTMYVGADASVHQEYVTRLLAGQATRVNGLYKLADDPRVTALGSLLRRTSLDEVPQLWNVLRGEMSLVGPRPALPFEAELFPDWASSRYQVAPGLTGLWQVSGRNRLTMLEGLALDVDYVARRTLRLDLVILLRTVGVVLKSNTR
jgi:lipopolysaccharide/colanic/teichoic acid biosynthesis glycosyltransferase